MKNRNLNKSLFEISIIIIFLLAIFISCQGLRYGNVVKKWHEPETRQIKMMPMVIINNKVNSLIYMPYIVYDKEDWCVNVTGIGTKGDTLTRKLYVSKAAYDTLKIGNFICLNGSCDKDTNNREVRK